MCWVSLEQVGCELEQMVVAQDLASSLEQGFLRSSKLLVFPSSLELWFLHSSELCVVCLFAQASALTLERASASL